MISATSSVVVRHSTPRSTRTMGFCALNGLFWVSAAGWVGGMAMAPPAARAETAHARFMAKRRAKVRRLPRTATEQQKLPALRSGLAARARRSHHEDACHRVHALARTQRTNRPRGTCFGTRRRSRVLTSVLPSRLAVRVIIQTSRRTPSPRTRRRAPRKPPRAARRSRREGSCGRGPAAGSRTRRRSRRAAVVAT